MNSSDSSFMPLPIGAIGPRPLTPRAHLLEVIMVLSYAVMSVLSFALIAHLRFNQSDAFKGNSSAARRVILPAFEPLLWILAVTTGAFALALFFILVLDVFANGTPKVASEAYYCGRQFVFVLIMVFLHQRSVSLPALRRCVGISIALATYTLPFAVYATYYGSPNHADLYFRVQRALRLCLVAWFIYIFCRPPSRASRRTIREFCGLTFVYQALSLASAELMLAKHVSSGQAVANAAVLWAALCPLVIWRVLRADTEYWRGLGLGRKHAVQEHVSSQGLHVLLELHRKLVLDFAYLKLRSKIGVGSSAIVYDGLLYARTPVAAKVYTPLALTADVVDAFSREAALCGALNHPNIVTFHGLCVCPPTIGLVFELCQASLETMIRQGISQSLTIAYMLDAARAVAYLHSFDPGFLHRDIKPANFLVDYDYNVKLADFGESRSVGAADAFAVSSPTVLALGDQRMTVKGTVEYMAPELIHGKGGFASYGPAADVYALAMTMWDVLHPGIERYPGCSASHLHVFQAVLDGKRPGLRNDLHPSLRDVIATAWHVDPHRRPTAADIVSILEMIEEEQSAAFLLESFEAFGVDSVALLVANDADEDEEEEEEPVDAYKTDRSTCAGAEAVAFLLRNEVVGTVGEALRIGRSWLDAGLVHHVQHAQGFTNDDAQFYLDDEALGLCAPIQSKAWDGSQSAGPPATKPPASVGSGRTHAASVGHPEPRHTALKSEATASVLHAGQAAPCACRQFGQRQLQEIKTRRRPPRFQRKKAPAPTTAMLFTPGKKANNARDAVFTDFEWHDSGNFRALPE